MNPIGFNQQRPEYTAPAQQTSHRDSFFQSLPKDEQDRKNIIDRLISLHNTNCHNPANKIHLEQTSSTARYPRLAQWIDATFSDVSREGMYLIAFALGGFADYHNLATVQNSMAVKMANSQFIANWFEKYGTSTCIGRLCELSETLGNIQKWHFLYKNDVQRFCSRVTPVKLASTEFEAISGTSEQTFWSAASFLAASTIFSQLYLESCSDIGFNVMAALSELGLNMQQSYTLREQYKSPLNHCVMAAIDRYIKHNQESPELFKMLANRFGKWKTQWGYGDAAMSFRNSLPS